MSTLTKRKNVTLAEGELEVVDRLRTRGSAEQSALRAIAGIELPANSSEAEGIRALIQVGLNCIEEKVNHDGYAALAAQRGSEEDRSTRDAIRRRGAAYRD